MTRSLVALLSFACGLLGCGAAPLVRFREPARALVAADYPSVHRRWTRRAHLTTWELDTAIDARATLLSAELRSAFVAKVAAMRNLTEAARGELEREHREDHQRFVDFVVLVETSRWEWNDLPSPRSNWTITAIDDRHRELADPVIAAPPYKPTTLGELFPGTTPFTRAYRIRFLRLPPTLLTEETRSITLRISGPLGTALLRWDAAP